MNPIQQFSIMKTAEVFTIPSPALFQIVVPKINSRVLGHMSVMSCVQLWGG